MVTADKIIELLDLKNSRIEKDELWASCPCPENHKHGDRKPSWSLNLKTLKHHCFACGFSGSLISLVMSKKQCSKSQAINLIYGEVTKEELLKIMSSGTREIKQITPLERDITNWLNNKHQYWYERGFNDETIKKWKLGYSQEMNRVVVPIYFKGELVGWTARGVNNATIPKWLHSPDLPREYILFGLDNVDSDSCVLVEAPLSAIKLDQYGIHNAVATFGCQLSEGQARLIRANFDNVLIFYDPDPAGYHGTKKAISMLEPHCKVFVVQPTRDDPAAMTKEECIEAIYKKGVIPSWCY